MMTYYVATLARYVLVDAENETQARELGRVALHDLYAEVLERLGKDVPIEVRLVREATDDEIDMENWFQNRLREEACVRSIAPALRRPCSACHTRSQ